MLVLLLSACGRKEESQTISLKEELAKPYYTSWGHYLGDPGRSHFSYLSQIDTSNVSALRPGMEI